MQFLRHVSLVWTRKTTSTSE